MLRIKITKQQLKEVYIVQNKTRMETANIFCCSVDTIKNRLIRFKLKKKLKLKYLSISKIKNLIKKGMTIKNMAKECDCSTDTIKKKLKQHCIKLKKEYKVDNDYFKKWSCDMAYLVGMIMADGCVRDKRKELTLVSIDEELIEFFQKQLKSNYKSYKNKFGCGFVSVYSKDIVIDLMKLGIVPRKSKIISLSAIPSKQIDIYFWDILRGIVDGDGCILKPNKRTIRFNICSGSKLFLEQIREILMIKTNCPKYKIVSKKESNSFYVNFNGRYAYQCFDEMYNNDKFALQRKKSRALQSIRDFEDRKYCRRCRAAMIFYQYSASLCLNCRS